MCVPKLMLFVSMAFISLPGFATAQECCAVSESTAESSVPWLPGSLRNTIDPISGQPTSPDFSLDYVDEDAGVFGRIHFAGKASLDAAKSQDLKGLYKKAFLVRDDGTYVPYGRTRIAIDYTFCPVSGVGAPDGRELVIDETMAVNCIAGSCSLGDGFKTNFNAVEIGACCPVCIKMLVANPDKFLPNIQAEIDAALSAQRQTLSEEKV